MKGGARFEKKDFVAVFLVLFFASACCYYCCGLILNNPEVTKCYVSDCIEHTINLGDEKIHLSFECEIKKSDCEQDCLLGTKILSLARIKSLPLYKKTECKYTEGKIYLGNHHSYEDLAAGVMGLFAAGVMGLLATVLISLSIVRSIFENVTNRREFGRGKE